MLYNELHENPRGLTLMNEYEEVTNGLFRTAPEGHCEFSPAIYGWVNGSLEELDPEGRMTCLQVVHTSLRD